MTLYNNQEIIRKDGFTGQRMTYLPGYVKKKILKDPRVSDLYITHIGIFPKAYGHLRNRPLGSSQHILLYCTDGKGFVETEGKKHYLNTNQMIVIKSKTACRYGSDSNDPWTLYWFHYTGKNSEIYSPPFNQVLSVYKENIYGTDERQLLFEDMLVYLENYLNSDNVIFANISLKYFLTSVKYNDVYNWVKKDKINDRLSDIINYMKNNTHRNLKINDIAHEFGCSASNIYKLFKKDLESAPLDFFIHLKIEKAHRYLLLTNMKVKEISRKLGYDDPYYFSRIFTKHTGISPAKFRREEKG
ncbi:MAG: AraC family transcriptional regulator [Chlorobi bacterium]|nr:AraC family transcriptional regulator [Chlorobiota bacterium]